MSSCIKKENSEAVSNSLPVSLDVVLKDFAESWTDVNLVEVDLVVSINLKSCLWVLQIINDHLKISPLSFSVSEFFADLSSGVWVIFNDHLNNKSGQLIHSFDEFSLIFFLECILKFLVGLVEVFNSSWFSMEAVVEIDGIESIDSSTGKESTSVFSSEFLVVLSSWIILEGSLESSTNEFCR